MSREANKQFAFCLQNTSVAQGKTVPWLRWLAGRMDKAQNIVQCLDQGHILRASLSVHANDSYCLVFRFHTEKGFVNYDNQTAGKVTFPCNNVDVF